jgi:CRISPR-associated helicase Cas3
MLELDVTPISFNRLNADWLPGYRPYEYQWRAFECIQEAMTKGRSICLFLVTPTGSGKTLASHAYSLRTGTPILGIYPTNELIADQKRALAFEYERICGWHDWVLEINSSALDDWQTELEYSAHSETLETVLNWQRVILTNPDILFFIFFGRYQSSRWPAIAQRLFRLVADVYPIVVFDEFHLYNVKQKSDVAFLVGTLHRIKPERPRVFIFASATPDEEVLKVLKERVGLEVMLLEAQLSNGMDCSIIAHPVHLSIAPADLDRWRGGEALGESWSHIDKFFSEYPQGRIVAIFDSVTGAIECAARFRERFPTIEIGEVHGLSSNQQRELALTQPVTVGTTTIEVGVDFKGEREKDYLIFEARTSSQFIQRFGRIARHAKSLPIPNYALALVPPYVFHSLSNFLNGKTVITRQDLSDAVDQAYRRPEEFKYFLKKHACVEMRVASILIKSMFQPDIRPLIAERIEDLITQITDNYPGSAWRKYRQYKEEGILTPLLDFRGNQFQAAILDQRQGEIGFPAKEYDLMFILRRGVFKEITEEDFKRQLERLIEKNPEWNKEFQRTMQRIKMVELKPDQLLGVYGFFQLTGLLNQSRRLWFEADEEMLIGHKGQVVLIEQLSIHTEPSVVIPGLNRRLRRKKLIAWFTDQHPSSIRLGRSLPPLFEIYPLRVVKPGGGISESVWSIAFNQNAFFLDSLYWNTRKTQTDVIVI